jgi:hypothetical protein
MTDGVKILDGKMGTCMDEDVVSSFRILNFYDFAGWEG